MKKKNPHFEDILGGQMISKAVLSITWAFNIKSSYVKEFQIVFWEGEKKGAEFECCIFQETKAALLKFSFHIAQLSTS